MKPIVLSRRNSYEQLIYWSVFITGLIVMAFGIALMITAHLGSAPWDVFHIGLFNKLGLTIGTWSIIVGFIIVATTSILTKKWPQPGVYLNMILVGIFIDLFLAMPAMTTPVHLYSRVSMLMAGILVNGAGISVYIAARRGAGPRDTLMLYLTEKTGWRLAPVRRLMELAVLIIGWLMGGPVSFGTFIFGLTIGSIVGLLLPLCEKSVSMIIERGVCFENLDKRPLRANDYDGSRKKC